MIRSAQTPQLRRSIFVKLLAIMLSMTTLLLVLVIVSFALYIYPNTVSVAEHVLADYSRAIAQTSPDFKAAKEISRQFDVQIRYEGPDGGWATSNHLPTIDQVRRGQAQSNMAFRLIVRPAPKGGAYLFAWSFHKQLQATHTRLLWLLLFFVIVVMFTTYLFQKRLLRPVRSLSSGVQQLSAGHLDVVLPVTTSDEFGLLTDAFNQMVLRVNQMIQARDQLLLDVSHELRSPLTRMKVALELLPENDMKAGIAADLKEMEAMITEILELERLRDGRAIRRTHQDLIPILRDVARSYEARSPGIRFAAIPPKLLLDIDAEKVRIVFRNVLENAAKYSLTDSLPAEISATRNGSQAVVCIRDDGTGIPDADLPNLFEPFYRVDRSRSKQTGGYGLGLSICRRIMEAHGGSITAKNNLGRGASLLLIFPISE